MISPFFHHIMSCASPLGITIPHSNANPSANPSSNHVQDHSSGKLAVLAEVDDEDLQGYSSNTSSPQCTLAESTSVPSSARTITGTPCG